MPGGRIQISAFDGTKKLDWFNADLNGFFYTMLAIFAFTLIICLAIYGLMSSYSPKVLIPALAIVSAIVAFVLVFCLRWNKTVIGEPRKFRYLCRWL